jgi:hypothetical protein
VETVYENNDYLTKQIITYIGVRFIDKGIRKVQKELGKDKLDIFDVFSGSGIVARYFKQYSDLLLVNDTEERRAMKVLGHPLGEVHPPYGFKGFFPTVSL